MGAQAKILVKQVELGYKKSGGTITILKNLNLAFQEGDLVGIVGLNGIGKSTLLRSLSGLLPVLSGEILYEGKNISELSLQELSKKVSIVLTEKIGGFNLKVYDVVASGQMPYTNSFNQLRPEHQQVIASALEACGMTRYQDRPVIELSDGLFQKTVIAKALAQQTPVMLLDEPSAFLDYASKHELFLLLKKLSEKEGKCILVSSHDLDLLVKYCSRLLVISPGSTELISAADAMKHPAFLEIGGGFL